MQISARLAIHSAAPERRRARRSDTHVPAIAEGGGYYGIPVTLNDISAEGFCVDAGVHVPPQSIIRVTLPGLGLVVGRVIWSKRGKIGGEFVNPISRQRLMLIPGMRLALG